MVIKVKRGSSVNLPSSGAIDGEIKFTTDTNDLYVYNAGNRNVTSPPVVRQDNGGWGPDTDYTIANINLFRFYTIYCVVDSYNTSPIRIPKEMFPQGSGTTVYPVWYSSGTVLTFNLTFTYVNSTSVKVRHNLSGKTITIYIYKEK